MNWIASLACPVQRPTCKTLLAEPGWVVMSGMTFALTISIGFLYVVGLQPLALCLAMMPCILTAMLVLCLLSGYTWHGIAGIRQNTDTPDFSRWQTYLVDGFQLVAFYGTLTVFCICATFALMPFGLLIPLLLIVFHPVIISPLLLASHERTFLALFDACLESVELMGTNYACIWAETTLYLLVGGGLLYPLAFGSLAVTGVGLPWALCLPGAFLTGYCHLLHQLLDETPPETDEALILVSAPTPPQPVKPAAPFPYPQSGNPWHRTPHV